MDAVKPLLLRWLAKTLLVLLAIALVLTLTLSGLIRALDASQLWLSQIWGPLPAMLAVALICLLPLLLSIWVISGLQRRWRQQINDNSDGEMRSLVRAHPWEAVTAAFVCGFSYRSDPHVSALLLKESLQQLREKKTEQTKTP